MRSITFLLLAIALIGLSLSSCYYDKSSELYPQQTCDTGTITWTHTVQPIINTSCAITDCHTGGTPAGNVDLTTYAGVHTQVTAGALLGSIEHQTGYVAMPNGGDKLPECTISQIRSWIAAGAPEN